MVVRGQDARRGALARADRAPRPIFFSVPSFFHYLAVSFAPTLTLIGCSYVFIQSTSSLVVRSSRVSCLRRRSSSSARRAMAASSSAGTVGSEESASLLSKRCIPCEGGGEEGGDLEPLDAGAAQAFMPQIPLWDLREQAEGEATTLSLARTWKTKNFTKALGLIERIGMVAEQQGHHPDLHLTGWNNLECNIFTHAIGGLSENDFILAAKIEAINVEDLVRVKKKKSLF